MLKRCCYRGVLVDRLKDGKQEHSSNGETNLVNANQDVEHLKLLSIFHYIVAGVFGLFSLFPLIHVGVGLAVVSGAFEDGSNSPPSWFGWIFVVAGSVFITIGLAVSVCVGIAGRKLGRHESHMFCIVIACIECLFAPFGTTLGVFTLIVLLRPSVKELFNAGEMGKM